MNVDKFGHHINKIQIMENISTRSTTANLLVDDNNNFNAQYKVIKHIATPIDQTDCATKGYIDKQIEINTKKINTLNQTVQQMNTDITSLSKNVELLSHKIKKK